MSTVDINIMEEAYNNINRPSGISSIKKLFDDVRKTNPNITIKDVKEFLSGQDSYTLHKDNRIKFPRRKFLFSRPGHTIVADVAYTKPYNVKNNPYLLVLIDGFSRFLSILPLQSLKSVHVKPVLDSFFSDNIYRYEKMLSDEGVEFLNKNMEELYKKHKIVRYSTYNRTIKASIAERVILTIKNKIKRYVTLKNTEYFMDVLQTFVNSYNNSDHRGLGYRKPLNVHLMVNPQKILKLSQRLYKEHVKKLKSLGGELSVNQVVRIQALRHTFARSIHVKNTYELFKVIQVNKEYKPITYVLSELDGDPIQGTFYIQELTPVKDSGSYEIEVLRSRKRKNRTDYLIKYVNYPSSKATWVSEKNLTRLS